MSDTAVVTPPGAPAVVPVVATPAAPAAPKPGTPEHAAALASLAPANVPDKFKNADGTVNVAELTKAYSELERKQSVPPAPVTPKKDEPVASLDEAFKAPVQQTQAQVWTVAQTELAAEGKITEVTREALKKAHNATDEMIDGMVAGHVAQREAIGRRLADAAGGVQEMNSAIAFARTKMNDGQLAALRSALEGPTGTFVMAGLVAQMKATQPPVAAAPAAPKSLGDAAPAGMSGEPQPFTSNAEMLAAFRDPRYQTDPAYQRWCGLRMQAGQRKTR